MLIIDYRSYNPTQAFVLATDHFDLVAHLELFESVNISDSLFESVVVKDIPLIFVTQVVVYV